MVLINAGASVVNINIIADGITTFTRDVTIGGNQFTEEIQKQLNVSYDEAEALKVGGKHGDQDAVVPQEVERVIAGVAEQMAGEIQRSLDFYASTAADSHIAKVYLSGGTAKIPALFKTIESRVGVPVEIVNPFKNVEIDNRRFDPNLIMELAPMAAVAVGLLVAIGILARRRLTLGTDDDEDLTDLQWARTMLDLKMLPSMEQVFSFGFLGESAAKSYTLAGAFVRWVLNRYGSATVRAWYAGAALEDLTREPWATLVPSAVPS